MTINAWAVEVLEPCDGPDDEGCGCYRFLDICRTEEEAARIATDNAHINGRVEPLENFDWAEVERGFTTYTDTASLLLWSGAQVKP